MIKQVLTAGSRTITDLLSRYLICAGIDAQCHCIDDVISDDVLRERLSSADAVIIFTDKAEEGLKQVLFAKRIIETLINNDIATTVAHFAPKKSTLVDEECYRVALDVAGYVREYDRLTDGKGVLYKYVEVYGADYVSPHLDSLILTEKCDDVAASYEYLHIDDLLHEMYCLISGVPTLTGYENYAFPRGGHFASDGQMIQRFKRYSGLSPCEVPDFASDFDKKIYDYYLGRKKQEGCYILGGGDEQTTLLSSSRFGSVDALRIEPGQTACADIGDSCHARLFILCGSVAIDGKTYCADADMLRLDVNSPVSLTNTGSSVAVVQIWRYNNMG